MTDNRTERRHDDVQPGPTLSVLRLNLVNRYVAQRLLFRGGLERKPVNASVFRLVWPLLTQRRLLMPLMRPKGITCFYSRALVRRLARLIGDRPCLEIAARDGTLSRFLAAEGVRITATGDHSRHRTAEHPDDVLNEDPRVALRAHQPQVVLCSWPPPGNSFEQHVFRTPSVELYIVVSTRDESLAGDWDAYRDQADFVRFADPQLNRLVLPPEIEPAVLIFRRVGEQ
ncbi:hypothetical protein [Spirilliplanes yamanashiensis]|uniref:Uncharacterized protein n=1 Tax=Spirilliplanes yamanashiensis TaxID=42233 RepID=A0A8J3YER3_9ACTN|nr:hypothetical protein [Spirilliplanes yamanashiensis]MDP9818370.1 hypothetical protein [Spirilliplanes yamanashiensis]GIJ06590.1 hypothetical protein Sya03_59420 [Spirilliplanes yamanashiensis]